jgi:hypothetical protein
LNESLCGVPSGASLVADRRLAPFLSPFSEKNLMKRYALHPDGPLDFQAPLTSVARLHAAGVPILAGTDAPNRGTATGVSMHRELELLVHAGLTATEALAAATSSPAKAFSLADRGRIAVGCRADLLLVEGDPTADILAARNIVSVWKLGHKADRDTYRVEQRGLRFHQQLVSIVVGAGIATAAGVLLLLTRRRLRRGPMTSGTS